MRKGVWSWNLPYQTFNWWDPYLSTLVDHGVTIWLPKIIDGTGYYNGVALGPAVLAARARRIDTWVWGYMYPSGKSDPGLEGMKLGMRANTLLAQAVVVDVEKEWTPATGADIVTLVEGIRRNYDRGPVYATSYGIARVHPEFPWDAVNRVVDGWIPQVYDSHVARELDMAIADFAALSEKVKRPYPLAAVAFFYDAVPAALAAAKERNLQTVTFWDYDHLDAAAWAAIRDA